MTSEEKALSEKYLLFLRLSQGFLTAPILLAILWYGCEFVNKRYLYEIPSAWPGQLAFLTISGVCLALCAVFFLVVCFGMRKESWKEIERKTSARWDQSEPLERLTLILGEKAAVRVMKTPGRKDIDTLQGALSCKHYLLTIQILKARVHACRNLLGVPSRKSRTPILAAVLIPCLLLVLCFIPGYLEGINTMQHVKAAVTPTLQTVLSTLESCCESAFIPVAPEEYVPYDYTVSGYVGEFDTDEESSISVKVNHAGKISEVSYSFGVDTSKSKEDNLQKAQELITKWNNALHPISAPVQNPRLLELDAFPEEFIDAFIRISYDEEFFWYDVIDNCHLSCSYARSLYTGADGETNPYIYFSAFAKKDIGQ